MNRHNASSQCDTIKRGMTFCVQSGNVRGGDALRLSLSGDRDIEVIVERFDVTGLYLTLEGQSAKCRPWRNGDLSVRRCYGTGSSWTVETLVAASMALA